MALLRVPGFRLLLAGFFLSAVAPWAGRTAILIWAYSLTHSGVTVSLVGLMEALPFLVLAPVAGVLVDRWSRARTMACAALCQGAVMLPLLLVHDASGLWLLLLVTLLVNCAAQFMMPAALAAIPVVVGLDRVAQANSLVQTLNSLVFIIAPAMASLLFAFAGPRGLILVLIAIYALSAPLLAAVPAPRPEVAGAGRSSLLGEMRAGLDYVRRSPTTMAIIAVVFIALLGAGALNVIDVVFVTRALHLRSETVGVLFTASGAGQLVGGAAIMAISGWAATRHHLVLGAATVLVGGGVLVYAAAPDLVAAAASLFFTGLMLTPLMVSFNSLIQLEIEDAFMGRVMSLINSAITVASVISLASGGALADLFGVRRVMDAAGLLIVISGLATFALIRSTPRRAPGAPARDEAPAAHPRPRRGALPEPT